MFGVTYIEIIIYACIFIYKNDIWKWLVSHIWVCRVTYMTQTFRPFLLTLPGKRKIFVVKWLVSRLWVSRVRYMNESRHIYEWVVSHVWVSHVICRVEWLVSRVWVSHVTYVSESCHMYEWVMSHMWVSHVTYMSASCNVCAWFHICERVMSHIRVSHVTYVNREWVMSHVWVSHMQSEMVGVAYMSESCHIYEWVMSNIWGSLFTCVSESCHTYESVTSMNESHIERKYWCRIDEWVVSHICVSCHIYGCVVSHIWVNYVTYMGASCHIYGCVVSHIWVSRVTHMSAWYRIKSELRIYEWVMSRIRVSHVKYMSESCHIYSTSRHIHEWVTSHIESVTSHTSVSRVTYKGCAIWRGCHITYTLSELWHIQSESRHIYQWVTWLRCVIRVSATHLTLRACHVTYICELRHIMGASRHIYNEWVTSHIESVTSHTSVSRITHMSCAI